MSLLTNENRFDMVLKIGHYQRVMHQLKVGGKTRSFSKVRELDKYIKMPSYNLDGGPVNLCDYPISEDMLTACILEDQSQTLWQLAIRVSEYNCKGVVENYQVLRALSKQLPDGFFIHTDAYYNSFDNLIRWIPR